MSWTDWVERWERQQERYLVDRTTKSPRSGDTENDAILVAIKRTAA